MAMSLEQKAEKLRILLNEVETGCTNLADKMSQTLLPQYAAKHNALKTKLDQLRSQRDLLRLQLSKLTLSLQGQNLELDPVMDPPRVPPLTEVDADSTRLLRIGLGLTAAPSELTRFAQLKELSLARNSLDAFPQALLQLAGTLEKLDVSGNRLTELPTTIGSLTKLVVLVASDNQIATLQPKWSHGLGALEVLNLHNNRLTETAFEPEVSLPKVRSLALSRNQLRAVPEAVRKMAQLIKLYLDHNMIEEMPASLEPWTRLQWLTLDFNQLKAAEPRLCALPSLVGLGLSNNKIKVRPEFPLHLRVLRLEANVFNAPITQDDATAPAAAAITSAA